MRRRNHGKLTQERGCVGECYGNIFCSILVVMCKMGPEVTLVIDREVIGLNILEMGLCH